MKRFLLILVCSAAVSSVFAQKNTYGSGSTDGAKGPGLRFGLSIAPTVSWMRPTSSKSDDKLYVVNSEGTKAGFIWGLMVDYFFSDNYAIATGFQVNSTGGRINATLNDNVLPPKDKNIVQQAYFDYSVQYLEIPIGLKLLSDDLEEGIQIFGNIGISAGFPVGKKATYEVSFTDGTDIAGKDIVKTVAGEKEKIQGTGITPALLTLNVGAGLEFPASEKLRMTAGVFFNNGFAPDVTNPKNFKFDYKGTFTDGTVRLNNLALRIGIFF